mmetsp:Transcript_27313/g.41533  ORF Transcript_27313/g.41533 Transcript_27313/m.41533 type:complete len:91 (+) Transcript_27313:873-1145(+)
MLKQMEAKHQGEVKSMQSKLEVSEKAVHLLLLKIQKIEQSTLVSEDMILKSKTMTRMREESAKLFGALALQKEKIESLQSYKQAYERMKD